MGRSDSKWRLGRFWGPGLLLIAGLSLLSGCGSAPASNSGASSPGQDVVTASDESEGRRRARIRLELATSYFSNGQVTVALDEVKQAIAIDPTYFDAYNLRGLVYQRLSNPALAEESFRKALALNPSAASVQHNYGLFLCQQGRSNEGLSLFKSAVANPLYADRSKTYMAMAGCELALGRRDAAEANFMRSYELDAGNPFTAYNLSKLLYERGEYARAQFYIRRLNNGALANSESLWLGIKVEQRMGNADAMAQLATQLRRRFPDSRELSLYDRGAFNE